MALSATPAKVNFYAPKGGQAGILVFSLTFASTYSNGALDLSTIAGKLPGVTPKNLKFVLGSGPAGETVVWTPATTPTWASLGTLKVFAGGTEVSGTYTSVINCIATFFKGDNS